MFVSSKSRYLPAYFCGLFLLFGAATASAQTPDITVPDQTYRNFQVDSLSVTEATASTSGFFPNFQIAGLALSDLINTDIIDVTVVGGDIHREAVHLDWDESSCEVDATTGARTETDFACGELFVITDAFGSALTGQAYEYDIEIEVTVSTDNGATTKSATGTLTFVDSRTGYTPPREVELTAGTGGATGTVTVDWTPAISTGSATITGNQICASPTLFSPLDDCPTGMMMDPDDPLSPVTGTVDIDDNTGTVDSDGNTIKSAVVTGLDVTQEYYIAVRSERTTGGGAIQYSNWIFSGEHVTPQTEIVGLESKDFLHLTPFTPFGAPTTPGDVGTPAFSISTVSDVLTISASTYAPAAPVAGTTLVGIEFCLSPVTINADDVECGGGADGSQELRATELSTVGGEQKYAVEFTGVHPLTVTSTTETVTDTHTNIHDGTTEDVTRDVTTTTGTADYRIAARAVYEMTADNTEVKSPYAEASDPVRPRPLISDAVSASLPPLAVQPTFSFTARSLPSGFAYTRFEICVYPMIPADRIAGLPDAIIDCEGVVTSDAMDNLYLNADGYRGTLQTVATNSDGSLSYEVPITVDLSPEYQYRAAVRAVYDDTDDDTPERFGGFAEADAVDAPPQPQPLVGEVRAIGLAGIDGAGGAQVSWADTVQTALFVKGYDICFTTTPAVTTYTPPGTDDDGNPRGPEQVPTNYAICSILENAHVVEDVDTVVDSDGRQVAVIRSLPILRSDNPGYFAAVRARYTLAGENTVYLAPYHVDGVSTTRITPLENAEVVASQSVAHFPTVNGGIVEWFNVPESHYDDVIDEVTGYEVCAVVTSAALTAFPTDLVDCDSAGAVSATAAAGASSATLEGLAAGGVTYWVGVRATYTETASGLPFYTAWAAAPNPLNPRDVTPMANVVAASGDVGVTLSWDALDVASLNLPSNANITGFEFCAYPQRFHYSVQQCSHLGEGAISFEITGNAATTGGFFPASAPQFSATETVEIEVPVRAANGAVIYDADPNGNFAATDNFGNVLYYRTDGTRYNGNLPANELITTRPGSPRIAETVTRPAPIGARHLLPGVSYHFAARVTYVTTTNPLATSWTTAPDAAKTRGSALFDDAMVENVVVTSGDETILTLPDGDPSNAQIVISRDVEVTWDAAALPTNLAPLVNVVGYEICAFRGGFPENADALHPRFADARQTCDSLGSPGVDVPPFHPSAGLSYDRGTGNILGTYQDLPSGDPDNPHNLFVISYTTEQFDTNLIGGIFVPGATTTSITIGTNDIRDSDDEVRGRSEPSTVRLDNGIFFSVRAVYEYAGDTLPTNNKLSVFAEPVEALRAIPLVRDLQVTAAHGEVEGNGGFGDSGDRKVGMHITWDVTPTSQAITGFDICISRNRLYERYLDADGEPGDPLRDGNGNLVDRDGNILAPGDDPVLGASTTSPTECDQIPTDAGGQPGAQPYMTTVAADAREFTVRDLPYLGVAGQWPPHGSGEIAVAVEYTYNIAVRAKYGSDGGGVYIQTGPGADDREIGAGNLMMMRQLRPTPVSGGVAVSFANVLRDELPLVDTIIGYELCAIPGDTDALNERVVRDLDVALPVPSGTTREEYLVGVPDALKPEHSFETCAEYTGSVAAMTEDGPAKFISLTGLTVGTEYNVLVRTLFTEDSGANYYSLWSPVSSTVTPIDARPIADVTLTPVDGAIEVAWSVPDSTADGGTMSTIQAFGITADAITGWEICAHTEFWAGGPVSLSCSDVSDGALSFSVEDEDGGDRRSALIPVGVPSYEVNEDGTCAETIRVEYVDFRGRGTNNFYSTCVPPINAVPVLFPDTDYYIGVRALYEDTTAGTTGETMFSDPALGAAAAQRVSPLVDDAMVRAVYAEAGAPGEIVVAWKDAALPPLSAAGSELLGYEICLFESPNFPKAATDAPSSGMQIVYHPPNFRGIAQPVLNEDGTVKMVPTHPGAEVARTDCDDVADFRGSFIVNRADMDADSIAANNYEAVVSTSAAAGALRVGVRARYQHASASEESTSVFTVAAETVEPLEAPSASRVVTGVTITASTDTTDPDNTFDVSWTRLADDDIPPTYTIDGYQICVTRFDVLLGGEQGVECKLDGTTSSLVGYSNNDDGEVVEFEVTTHGAVAVSEVPDVATETATITLTDAHPVTDGFAINVAALLTVQPTNELSGNRLTDDDGNPIEYTDVDEYFGVSVLPNMEVTAEPTGRNKATVTWVNDLQLLTADTIVGYDICVLDEGDRVDACDSDEAVLVSSAAAIAVDETGRPLPGQTRLQNAGDMMVRTIVDDDATCVTGTDPDTDTAIETCEYEVLDVPGGRIGFAVAVRVGDDENTPVSAAEATAFTETERRITVTDATILVPEEVTFVNDGTTVTITWTPPTLDTSPLGDDQNVVLNGYRICEFYGGENFNAAADCGTSLSITTDQERRYTSTIAEIDPGVRAHYALRTRLDDGADTGLLSNWVLVDGTVTTAPEPITVDSVTVEGSVPDADPLTATTTVSWTATVPDLREGIYEFTHFVVCASTTPIGAACPTTATSRLITDSTVRTVAIPGLTIGDDYYIAVRAVAEFLLDSSVDATTTFTAIAGDTTQISTTPAHDFRPVAVTVMHTPGNRTATVTWTAMNPTDIDAGVTFAGYDVCVVSGGVGARFDGDLCENTNNADGGVLMSLGNVLTATVNIPLAQETFIGVRARVDVAPPAAAEDPSAYVPATESITAISGVTVDARIADIRPAIEGMEEDGDAAEVDLAWTASGFDAATVTFVRYEICESSAAISGTTCANPVMNITNAATMQATITGVNIGDDHDFAVRAVYTYALDTGDTGTDFVATGLNEVSVSPALALRPLSVNVDYTAGATSAAVTWVVSDRMNDRVVTVANASITGYEICVLSVEGASGSFDGDACDNDGDGVVVFPASAAATTFAATIPPGTQSFIGVQTIVDFTDRDGVAQTGQGSGWVESAPVDITSGSGVSVAGVTVDDSGASDTVGDEEPTGYADVSWTANIPPVDTITNASFVLCVSTTPISGTSCKGTSGTSVTAGGETITTVTALNPDTDLVEVTDVSVTGVSSSTREYDFTGLALGQSYYFAVRAVYTYSLGSNEPGRNFVSSELTKISGFAIEETTMLNDAIVPDVAAVALASTVTAITNRIDAAASVGGAASLSFGGVDMGGAGGYDKTVAEALRDYGKDAVSGDVDTLKMLGNSQFSLPLNATESAAGGGVTMWGSGEYRRIGGDNDEVDWDGDLSGFHLGMDKRMHSKLMAGVAVSWLRSDADWEIPEEELEGTHETNLTSVNLYAGSTNSDIDLWVALGGGQGDLTVTNEDDEFTSDISMFSFGVGAAGEVWNRGNTSIRLKSEIMTAALEVDAAEEIAGTRYNSNRLRLTVEAEKSRRNDDGGIMRRSVELGARYDGGDTENGAGAELGGKINYTNPVTRLSVEGKARVLVGHSGGAEEWGVQGTIGLLPGADQQGASFTLTPRYGNANDGIRRLWQNGLSEAQADGNDATDNYALSMGIRVGYGVAVRGYNAVLTPYSSLSLGATERYQVGMHWDAGEAVDVTLTGERDVSAAGAVNDAVVLKGVVGF